MLIHKLNITDVRNLKSVSIQPSPFINIFSGLNGSGKTSLLESIHILGLGRSFRTARINPIIRSGAEKYTIFGLFESLSTARHYPVGVSRGINDDVSEIKVLGEKVKSSSDLAKLIPIQVINPETFKLLEGSPRLRRSFLDWGLFHVKHEYFFPVWKKLQKVLKQRNSLLRHGIINEPELAVWTREFTKAAMLVDEMRQEYIEQLLPYFYEMLSMFSSLENISISYYRGWDKDQTLDAVLKKGLQRDIQSGYTQAGPQRADIRVRVRKHNALDILSRGQIKLVVCALKLAQSLLLSKATSNRCVFLVDDLASELDRHHREALCGLLQQMKSQVFITCIEQNLLTDYWLPDTDCKMFHVEQGQIELIEKSCAEGTPG